MMNYSYTMPNEVDTYLEASSVEIPVSMNPHLFSFDLHSITDVGGTLSVGFHLKGKVSIMFLNAVLSTHYRCECVTRKTRAMRGGESNYC
jgi:hypothetical protein